MAVVIKGEVSDTKCWACGRKIGNDDVSILTVGTMGIIYLHPGCAQSISRKLLSDYVELTDLGYRDTDE